MALHTFLPSRILFLVATEQPRLSPYASRGKTSADARHAAVGESAERPCLPAPGHGCAKTVPARSINVAKCVSRASGGSCLLGTVQFVGQMAEKWGRNDEGIIAAT